METSGNKDERRRERMNEFKRDVVAGSVHASIRRIESKEMGKGVLAAQEAKRMYPGQLRAQIDYFIDHMDMAAGIGRKRRLSTQSVSDYRARSNTVVTHMWDLNMHPTDLLSITPRQMARVFEEMIERGLSASYLANLNTTWRRIGIWLNKPELCPPLKYLTDEKEKITRSMHDRMPKDWDEDPHLADELLQQVEEKCKYTAAQLKLAGAFGLRVEEALCAQPEKMIRSDSLYIIKGTKGGRPRMVPIETDKQRAVLAEALELASMNRRGLVAGKTHLTLRQAKNRFYTVMREVGVTRKETGLVAHGLRHGYARDSYKLLAGVESPVRGGPVIDKKKDSAVRQELAFRLGHSRKSIVAAYVPTHRGLTMYRAKNIKRLIEVLDKDRVLTELVKKAGAKAVYVCGPLAEGNRMEKNATVVIGIDAEQPLEMAVQSAVADRVTTLLGCNLTVVTMHASIKSDVPRLELLGLVENDDKPSSSSDA